MRIIFILPFSPKYAETTKDSAQPIHQWKNSKGELIGVWIQDHAHYFGFNLIHFYPSLIFEVWRPDYRAEKVYEHTFENGFVHRSFPSETIAIQQGLLRKTREYAPMMEIYLDKIVSVAKKDTLLMVPATGSLFSTRLFRKYHDKLPMLGYNFVSNNSLFRDFPPTFNPFRYLHFKIIAHQHKKHFKNIKNLSIPNYLRMEELKARFGCNAWFNNFGIDHEFWKNDLSKQEARKALNLGSEKIILFSSRLVPEYQIEKVLDVISLFRDYSFLCIFTSQGNKDYIEILHQKINTLQIEKHVLFTGWLDNENFKKYFSACDVFCSTSTQQAGPASTFFAMLMERPVMSTDAGLAAELLKKNGCGLIFPPTDYSKWEEAFASVIKNDPVPIKTIDREIIFELVDWGVRAKGWMDTFNAVVGSSIR
jgi:glycosyltransferase involved in cell wall biosynthesis